MNTGPNQLKDPWTALWQTGAGSSCFENADDELHLSQFWGEHVDALPDHARMLDLATGNGTVAQICAARAIESKKHLEIDAIDAADIDPSAHVPDADPLLARIRFHGNTHLEALPFRDGIFTSVVSQFGFEYACETRSASEIVRVLEPGGRLRLVIQAKSGAVARDVKLRLARMHRVLAENGPVSLVLELARANEEGDMAKVKSKSDYLPAAVKLSKELFSDPLPNDSALFYSMESLMLWAHRKRYTSEALRRSIEQGWTNINDMAVRQEQMLAAGRGKKDIKRIEQRFEAFGLTLVRMVKIRDKNNAQIAWNIDAIKPLDAVTLPARETTNST